MRSSAAMRRRKLDEISPRARDAAVPVYDELLKRDRRWAMDEGDRHFQRDRLVFKTLAEDRPTTRGRSASPMRSPVEWRSMRMDSAG